MTEIKLEKRFPHIPDEDVTRIFQDGYRKGWENARKKAIPIEWIENWKRGKSSIEQVVADKIMMDYKYRDYWEKENEQISSLD